MKGDLGGKDKSINHTVKIKSQLRIFYVILLISKATTVFFFFFVLSENKTKTNKKTICKNRVFLEKFSFSSLLCFQELCFIFNTIDYEIQLN